MDPHFLGVSAPASHTAEDLELLADGKQKEHLFWSQAGKESFLEWTEWTYRVVSFIPGSVLTLDWQGQKGIPPEGSLPDGHGIPDLGTWWTGVIQTVLGRTLGIRPHPLIPLPYF